MLLITSDKNTFEVGGLYHVVYDDKQDDLDLMVLSRHQGYWLCMQYDHIEARFRFRALFLGGEREDNVLNEPNVKVKKIEISYASFREHGSEIKQKG